MNFSDIPKRHQPKDRQSSLTANRAVTQELSSILAEETQSISCLIVRGHVSRILGVGRIRGTSLHASNIAVQSHLSSAFGEIVGREWEIGGARDHRLLTFTPDMWLISSSAPSTQLVAMRQQLSRWLRTLDVTSIAFLEISVFLNHPLAQNDRFYHWHAHAIAVPNDEAEWRERSKALKARLGRNSLGKYVFDARKISSTLLDVEFTSSYVTKNCVTAKRVLGKPGGKEYSLYNAPCPRKDILRVSEIKSYLSFPDLIVTTGNPAWQWRQELMRTLSPDILRVGSRLNEPELDRLWRRLSSFDKRPVVLR